MPIFVTNFLDKLSIYPKRTTAAPDCLQNWLYSVLCFNQLNDIRVPRAIFPRERYARSPKLGKPTLFWRHAYTLSLACFCSRKYENTAFKMQEIPLETQKFKTFSGGYDHTPGPH